MGWPALAWLSAAQALGGSFGGLMGRPKYTAPPSASSTPWDPPRGLCPQS